MRTSGGAACRAVAGAARLLVFVLMCPWVQQVLGPHGGSGGMVLAMRGRGTPTLKGETTGHKATMAAGKKLKQPKRGAGQCTVQILQEVKSRENQTREKVMAAAVWLARGWRHVE